MSVPARWRAFGRCCYGPAPVARGPQLACSLVGVALALAGCKDTPSYRLRWELVDSTDERTYALTKALDCSRFGVTQIRVRAFDPNDVLVDERFHACFAPGFEDPDELADGPEIRAGEYTLEVRGIQRDGETWIDDMQERSSERCPGGDFPCGARELVCDCQQFAVKDGETFADFDVFRLVAPRDCIDGIDNDGDGVVDGEDAGCQLQGIEAGAGVQGVQFTVRVTALDENPLVAGCAQLGLGGLQFLATDTESGVVTDLGTRSCQIGVRNFFSIAIEGDSAQEITVIGLRDGVAATVPVSAGEVLPGTGATVDLAADLDGASFYPPLVASASPLLLFAQDAAGTVTRDTCDPYDPFGTLAIAELTLALVDENGAEVPGAALIDGVPLDGSLTECVPARMTTAPLTWGAYRLVVNALASDGTVCWTTGADGLLLAPGSFDVVLDRVLDGSGVPPASCRDCSGDDDCGDYVCVASTCLPG